MAVGMERMGIDIGWRLPLEESIEWAIANDVATVDLNIDGEHDLLMDGRERLARARARAGEAGIRIGLHTNSNVNIAETAAYVGDAVDAYLEAYVRAAKALGAGWIVVHGGYHFSRARSERMVAAIERLERLCEVAEREDMTLLLENHNPEPDEAEIHYMPHDLEECQAFFSALTSPRLRWTFTVNHAHLLPVGIAGFLDGMDLARASEVRIADCRGTIEEHLRIGEGTIDFSEMFRLLEGGGYTGHYMLAFGSLDDMLADRDKLAAIAAAA